MEQRKQVILTRDVEAVLVPHGERGVLKGGQAALITQALGGSYTLIVGGNMFRIEAKDADALGEKALRPQPTASAAPRSREEVEAAVWEQLRTAYDPEIPVNIVELGLVYECRVMPLAGGWGVAIRMTLTAPGCGMGDYLTRDVEAKLYSIPGVLEAEVELVFDPPWNRDMMSETARLELNM